MIGRSMARFRITSELGSGGLGTVWKARDELLDRDVAVKVMRPELASDPKARQRFLREAQNQAQLDHPAIATIFEYGESDGTAYIAETWVDGETVAERIARSLLSLEECARVAADVADGLAHAHERRILHRDVTARNVMIGRKGHVYIVDFGLAVAADRTRITSSGTIMGTTAYIAPEVLTGAEGDARSDVYGLGVVMFELLTGDLPFPQRQREALQLAALVGPCRSPRELRPEIPPELEAIVLRALERDPALRWQSAAELRDALRGRAWHPLPPAVPLATAAPDMPGAAAVRGQADRRVPDPLYVLVPPFAADGATADERAVAMRVARQLAALLPARLALGARVHVVSAGREPIGELAGQVAALGANAALRGSVSCVGSQLRVVYTLERADAATVGSDVLDGSAMLPFELQDRVAASVARLVGVDAAAAAGDATRPLDPAAEDRYQQALACLRRSDREVMVDGAIALLEALTDVSEPSATHLGTLARAYLQKFGHTRERSWEARAATVTHRALQRGPAEVEVLVAAGDLAAGAGQHERALTAFRQARESGRSVEAELGATRVLADAGRVEEAEREAAALTARAPDDWRAWSMLGWLRCLQGRYDRAEPSLRRVVELTADNAKGWRNLAGALYHLDRLQEAVDCYRRSLAIQPDAWTYSGLGTVLHYLGRGDEAIQAFRKAVALSPADPVWLGNLGNACRWTPGYEAEAPLHLERAVAMMREALARNERSADGWARLAGWLGNLERHAEAAEARDRALALAPHDVACLMHGARVSLQIGERARALALMRDAVGRGYGTEELRRDPELSSLRDDPMFQAMLTRRDPDGPATHPHPGDAP